MGIRTGDESLNVIYIVLDDVGYSALGCYGSEIETPNIDSLAENGLRYNNFNVTPLCSPTRACLLTGRNCHSVGVGLVTEIDWGPQYPNKRGRISDTAATLAEILKLNGMATYMVGKWHLVPGHEAASSGPFENWPLSKGFGRYYGFLLGMTDQYAPDLVYDNHRVKKPKTSNYHLSEDLVDKTLEFLTDHLSVTPDRPFFLYLAFGAQHEPHQVPKEFIEKYKGVYDKGWDQIREERFERQKNMGVIPPFTELVDLNPGIKPWDELKAKEKELFIKFQQTYAGFLTHTDQQIGRLLQFLKEKNKLDNTILVLLSDNGGSQEGGWNGSINDTAYFNGIEENVEVMFDHIDEIGGPLTSPNYPKGWAQVCNTPFKYYKQDTFYGGTHVPLIIQCPQRIPDPGSIRSQFYHAIDITPTILDLLNMNAPPVYEGVPQMPMHGVSMKDTFTDAHAPSKRKTQYFEMVGHRAIWQDGWVAVTYHETGKPFYEDDWELYNVTEDYSQKYNLAAKYPRKLTELQAIWWQEATKYGVLPLDDRPFRKGYEGLQEGRTIFNFYPGMAHLPSSAAPKVTLSSYSITVPIFRSNRTEEGVLIAHGNHSSGYTFYIKDNYLLYEYNYVGTVYKIQSNVEVPVGYSTIRFEFIREIFSQGTGKLYIDGQQVGTLYMPRTLPFVISVEGMDIGRDQLTPVSPSYPVPEFPFSGHVEKVVIELHDDQEYSKFLKQEKREPIYININGTIIFL
ncbi:sulfatase-like hydrolase/transferase [Neobacillus sp. NPDC058068]|uniref:sulfatase-like hydrolase/transferase n=1 Tax=Neobacillus sp. NPDC058068 TaxID=3346325 RepID=UPI0036DED52C